MPHSKYLPRSRGVSRLYAHLVLVTKYRLDTMSPKMIEYLQQTSVESCQKWQVECIEVNGEENHLHIVFRYAPQMQLSKFINNFKSVSSRKVRKEFEVELRQFYWDWSKGFWSDGYSIDSVGFAPLEVDADKSFLKKYVQNQGQNCSSPLRSDSQASHPDSLPVRVRAGILSLKG